MFGKRVHVEPYLFNSKCRPFEIKWP